MHVGTLATALSELPEGHATRVVVDRDARAEALTQHLREGLVGVEVKERVAVPRSGVDAPRDVDVDVEDLGALASRARDELVDDATDLLHRLGRILQHEGQIILDLEELAL